MEGYISIVKNIMMKISEIIKKFTNHAIAMIYMESQIIAK